MDKLEDNSTNDKLIYTSEKYGNDEEGDGSETKPFKTPLKAYRQYGDTTMIIYIDSKDEYKGKWELLSKTQAKKIKIQYEEEKRKQERSHQQELEDAQRREEKLEEAKKIIIKEDPSLPPAEIIKIKYAKNYHGKRVKIYGWTHRIRRQGK
ncbi:unnamed protein product [Rotaria sp. Silwood1]|nr:unnamed protein product [Rotaria sp. Silwood1]